MGNGRKKLRIEVFFELFFSNIKKLLIANLLFAIPSAVIFVAYYYLNQLMFGAINIVFSMTALILLYPFYAGVVMVVRNIVRGDDAPAVKSFFSAIGHNFPVFLLHGVYVCAATVLSYFALSFYMRMLSQSWIMYVLLFFCILVVLMALYAAFYLPLMTLTYDIPLRYLYKNCFLMSFGELKHNFAATLALLILGGICLTATAFLPNATVLLIVFSCLWALVIPAAATYCYTFFIYPGMVEAISNKDARSKELDERIRAQSAGKSADRHSAVTEEEDLSDIDIDQLKDTDDFIFHNGRMVKQSTILKRLREKEAKDEVNKHEP